MSDRMYYYDKNPGVNVMAMSDWRILGFFFAIFRDRNRLTQNVLSSSKPEAHISMHFYCISGI